MYWIKFTKHSHVITLPLWYWSFKLSLFFHFFNMLRYFVLYLHLILTSGNSLSISRGLLNYNGYFPLLFLPTQMCFVTGGEHVPCYQSKLSNSLGSIGKQELELSTCMWSGHAVFELEGILKQSMIGPMGYSEFCFPTALKPLECLGSAGN